MKGLVPLFILAFSLVAYSVAYSQEKPDSTKLSRNTLFIELGGNAPHISLNYDYLIPTTIKNFKCALTIGATHHFNDFSDFVIAPQFQTLIGKKFMAEIGLGITIPIAYINDWVIIPRFGGRYQKKDGGMFYKLAFTPIITPYNNASILPMFGISIGYTFKRNRSKTKDN